MIIPLKKIHWWQAVIQKLPATRPGGWLFSRILPPLDAWVSRRSEGRRNLTALLSGLPIITLTTRGARSGVPRHCHLVAIPDGARLALIATNFGNKRHPSWVYNLRAHPEALVAYEAASAVYQARPASEEERVRYWVQGVALYAGYAAYKPRVGARVIPIWVLEPVQEVAAFAG